MKGKITNLLDNPFGVVQPNFSAQDPAFGSLVPPYCDEALPTIQATFIKQDSVHKDSLLAYSFPALRHS